MAELTSDIIAKREANKQRAIEKLRAARERLAAAKGGSSSSNGSNISSSNNSSNAGTFNLNGKRPAETTPGPGPSQHRKANQPTQRRDYSSRLTENYIEFDFSKMKDSKGGFMSDETAVKSKEDQMKEWKQQEKLNQARKY
jgi:hypothetical protein